MKEDQEMKHLCKFCHKSFPCGRSLGGHMRSHLMNQAESTEKLSKKKLSSFSNGSGGDDKDHTCKEAGAYSFRENRKKTSKFANPSGDTSLDTKLCKECGKGFPSWKALFGHMKCHSDKVSNSVEDDSWNSSADHKLVMDSQSDNEAAAPIRKQRSRTIKRYKKPVTETTTTITVANASPCVSELELEQDQEEVALSLIMLSRDVGGGHLGSWKSAGESSENNSEFLEARSSSQTNLDTKTESKNLKCSGGDEFMNLKSLKNGKLESSRPDSVQNLKFKTKQSESKVPAISRNELKLKNSEVPGDAFLGNDLIKKTKAEEGIEVQDCSQVGLPKIASKESGINQSELEFKKHKPNKRKCIALHDPELSTVDLSMNKLANYGASDSELYQQGCERKSKFECTACNKTFHSYQALGGHRASHKKMKGCFASKIDSSENSAETEISPDQTADSKLIKRSYSNDNTIDGSAEKLETDYGSKKNANLVAYGSKKNKEHECPICFKVFPSGQALGGHKRSHLIAEAKSNQINQNVAIQKSKIPEIKEFLDLNLPAPPEDIQESSDKVYFNPPWWMATSNHKHEPLVGLL